MKHGNEFYLELSRTIFTEEYEKLSYKAKWLFVVLNELEQRYTGEHEDFFFRSNTDLVKDAGMKLTVLKEAKAELLNEDLIQSWQMHFVDSKTGRKSEKKVTAYRVLK